MKKVIVFDLDDTLFDEYQFVKSGFFAVADYLSVVYQLNKNELFEWMWNYLEQHGRGKIFDVMLRKYNIYSNLLLKKCISIYRLHKPSIELPQLSKQILDMFSSYSLYLVTDGNKNVQNNKVIALNLEKYMKKCYITYRFGIQNSKPSPYCFNLIANKEKVLPKHIVYIGDNPKKDFVGIKPLGFRTIRVMTGQHRNIVMPDSYNAEIHINDLSELPQALKTIWSDFEIEGLK